MSKHLDTRRKSLQSKHRERLFVRVLCAAIALGLFHTDALAQRRQPKVAVPSTRPGSRVKGIWEPVNYDQDLTLESLYFVTPNVGWASGQGGTIIKTVDGGAHWTAQLGGDPQSPGSPVRDLRFVDQNHGFAVQSTGVGEHALLRTVDGRTWRSSGTIAQHRGDYAFISPTVGFVAAHNAIQRTGDAGRSWQKVMDCAARITVNGLSRNVACEIESLSFPTPQVGYGIGGSPDVKGVFVVRTADGGNTWAVWRVLDEESGHQGFTTFTDPNTGFLCVYGGKFFSTVDGGRTWDGVAGVDCGGGARGKFADPETGWTLETRRWNYTTDGGRSWGSRELAFPAGVNTFSLPRRDRGYVAGDHGMVYRYSVVAANYDAPNAISAPAVGAFNSPLDEQVEELAADVQAFSSENAAATTDASGNTTSAAMDASASGGSTGSSSTGSTGSSASGTTSDNAAAFDAGAGSSTARPRKAKGGGNSLGKLQALLDVIGSTMPDFLSRYRNLNLLFEGARTASGMPAWLQTVRGGLAAFRASSDKSSAAAALAQLLSAADSLKTQTRVAFMRSSFTPAADDAASNFAPMPAAAVAVDSAKPGAKNDAADAAKKAAADAVKKGVGGLLKNPFGRPRP